MSVKFGPKLWRKKIREKGEDGQGYSKKGGILRKVSVDNSRKGMTSISNYVSPPTSTSFWHQNES